MGRTEPSAGRPPASFRRDTRAKQNKSTANKVIPAMLAAHPRARRGVEASELIVDPPFAPPAQPGTRASRRLGPAVGNEIDDGDSNREGKSGRGPRISLRVADTLVAAYSLLLVPTASSSSSDQEKEQGQRRDLSNTTARVGVLNMASPLSAGGGFLIGAQGQEEASLCPRTTLFPALRDEFYRLPELGVVFTPDVLVFRGPFLGGGSTDSASASASAKDKKGEDDNGRLAVNEEGVGDEDDAVLLPKRDRWFVDVASMAMLRLPDIDVDVESGWARYANVVDRELAIRKMRALMRVFCTKCVKRVVLGAWGCGAYANPVGEIARAWRKVLLDGGGREGNIRSSQGKGKNARKDKSTESWDGIEHVVFAIKDAGMAQAFAAAFGEDLLERDEEEEGLGQGNGDDGVEDEKVKELRDKINELELRVEQSRTPQLRAGLNSVLAGLRSQLPESSDEQRASVGPDPMLRRHGADKE
ncbi:hypothetical protein F4677DRAFT_435696 [Hypoxylon crocopeplum]|nr:hypothetical protein F4677DRAFT_435696 [Hypoxylon crocopeplum]